MDVDIQEFKVKITPRSIAQIIVRYGLMQIKCDLVYYKKDDKFWVRMPEVWFNPKRKTRFAWWPTRDVSDLFQVVVLEKLFNDYEKEIFDAVDEMKSKRFFKKKKKGSPHKLPRVSVSYPMNTSRILKLDENINDE